MLSRWSFSSPLRSIIPQRLNQQKVAESDAIMEIKIGSVKWVHHIPSDKRTICVSRACWKLQRVTHKECFMSNKQKSSRRRFLKCSWIKKSSRDFNVSHASLLVFYFCDLRQFYGNSVGNEKFGIEKAFSHVPRVSSGVDVWRQQKLAVNGDSERLLQYRE